MTSIALRLAKLEEVKSRASARVMSDLEIAVRADRMISTKAPGWEKLAALFGMPAETLATKEIK